MHKQQTIKSVFVMEGRGNGVIKVDEKDFTERIHLIVTGLFRYFHLLHIDKYIISYQISSIYVSNKINDLYFCHIFLCL